MRIIVVDDQEVVAAGITRLLEAGGHETAYRTDVDGAIALLDASPDVDLVLLDVHLGGGAHAVELVPSLVSRTPPVRVLLLTGDEDPGLVPAALRVGALGVVRKTAKPSDLLNSVEVAAAGGAVLSTRDLGSVLGKHPRQGLLTSREHEILSLMDGGLSTTAMARRLVLSEHTVRGHVQNVLRKLGADSRVSALASARRKGLIGSGT